MKDNQYIVKKIGWENQNDIVPIILLSKSERDKIGVKEGDPVKVIVSNRDMDVVVISAVGKQFKDMLGKDSICSVNTQLAEKLRIIDGSKVTIDRNLTESEYKKFIKDSKQAIFFGFE